MLFLAPHAMHIPDNFLSTPVAIAGWAVAIVLIGFALRNTREQLGERQVPLMGILAAFIFAGQMLNFPVAGGTSGHLLGGALAAIIMGPWAAALIMTSVITVQALLFQDGGILALGWNIVNMGVLTAFTGYFLYRGLMRLLRGSRAGRLAGGFVGGWASVMVGAIATSVELAVSATSPLALTLPAMAFWHALIGIGEGAITVAALAFIQTTRPDLIAGEEAPARAGARWVWVGLLIALVVALFSPLASGSPDGLEFVAGEQGFLQRAAEPLYNILPDYTVPFIQNETLTVIAAGAIGVLIVFGITWAVGRLTRQKAPSSR
jgi:cobalt/nickel transport system permease protein